MSDKYPGDRLARKTEFFYELCCTSANRFTLDHPSGLFLDKVEQHQGATDLSFDDSDRLLPCGDCQGLSCRA